ncbi:flagellar hook protein FlgE [Idiomarina sp.]|uniref:flagellar hook protein FlgE n=1 Tax=Idiomarina sp. TaxID=1874361 RepID=UPI0025C6C730|nr:flagellar hook protein FlgE [Idiomarina sp.]
MSFSIALSGISSAQKDLDVTSNNVANVKTTGFKGSRAEFSDVYANSIFSGSDQQTGNGAATAAVAQQFSQGTLQFTQNSLDMAISGNGFFATTSGLTDQDFTYTRAGAFKLNDSSYIVNNQGQFLQGFPVDRDSGATQSTSLAASGPIRIPDSAGAPSATENQYQSFNLDARAPGVRVAEGTGPTAVPGNPFSVDDPTSYTSSTSTTIYDSLGESHVLTTYYVRRDSNQASIENNTWDIYTAVDGQVVDFDNGGASAEPAENGSTGVRVRFDESGSPLNANGNGTFEPGQLSLSGVLNNGADDTQQINVFFRDQFDSEGETAPTQFASDFSVNLLEQDGTTVGRLTNIDIAEDGLILASYSNGDVSYLGKVALVRFANEQGLTQLGNASWAESQASGIATSGEANSGVFGAVESSALESSNVDLTKELVDLISAQRNFQANSRALEINNGLQQNILQIR